ncbi:hypothetical protein RHGRI_035397 [Rhododendron griersonianum]|uniref:MORF/ORRM1/DAG-like MORF domain-containing protein n=1 Tax=Rhododendron griersonianum TaxID=479676 RepID=A0AAV6IAC9_9ERIC|nr:hypothetical protein RHGRI_035397 [Rhododendron griersonianum]
MMIPSRNILRIPLRLTAATVFQCLKPNETPSISRHLPPPISRVQRFSADSAATESPRPTRCSELTRVATLVDGCDYQHWLVVVEPPEGYPERSQIVDHFITTLALALGRSQPLDYVFCFQLFGIAIIVLSLVQKTRLLENHLVKVR